jgi:nucleotide-binding universal stress UspA family protein
MFEIVVVGADESPTAAEAVRRAAELVKISGGRLHIVTAYKARPVTKEELPDEFRYTVPSTGSADALLLELSHMVSALGVEPVTHAVTADPVEALITVADQEGADLIVVGNKGMTGVRRVLGSVPNSVAHHATCAVLILPTARP